MLKLDFTPLGSTHFFYLGVSFFLVYLLLQQFLQQARPPLRRAAHAPVYYAGPVFIVIVTLLAFFVLDRELPAQSLVLAAILIIFIGSIDERRALSPLFQLIAQVLVASVLIAGGWSITRLTNPFGEGVLEVASLAPFISPLPVAVITLLWFILLFNSINWLDGMDGLAAGVSLIAFLATALVALLPSIQDFQTITLAAIGAGACLGFLIWNYPPARVYLGTSGSWFLACYLGLVTIQGGGKIVTTMLILSLPLIDAMFVIIQRLASGRPPWLGDRRRHLHFRLLDLGWSPRSILWLALAVTAASGWFALTLQTRYKIAALIIAATLMGLALLYLARKSRRKISQVQAV